MRRLVASVTPLLLLLVGCGSSADSPPTARPSASDTPSSVRPSKTAPSRTSAPARTPSPSATTRTAAPTTSNPKDCFDGYCTLKLSKPLTIRLDTKKFYYPEMTVVAVGPDSLTYRVDYPHGGGAQQILSPGGGSAFGFRSHTTVEVKLVSITGGTALLALSPGTPD
ncbi:hypothetical protein AB0E27_14370 [Streptomyces sparsogenes]|uniref:hypothetical protein n=1 Tax=Streptomyces sparsogenes TaxID=67365 RepID=UPI0033EB7C96